MKLHFKIGLLSASALFFASLGDSQGQSFPMLTEVSCSQPDGVRVDITVKLWTADEGSSDAVSICTTERPQQVVKDGKVRIALDPSCSLRIDGRTDVWQEETVNKLTRRRRKQGSVPLAVAAARANSATGELELRLQSLIPAGSIIAFGSEKPPYGWALCDGTDYPCSGEWESLCRAIGTSWGGIKDGDRITRFWVPDLRGRFLRGWTNGSGKDPDVNGRTRTEAPNQAVGDHVGSLQDDQFAKHGHWPDDAHRYYIAKSGGGNNTLDKGDFSPKEPNLWESGIAQAQERGGAETRPKNAYVSWIIKK